MSTILMAMIALVGGNIHTGNGEVIPSGSLLIQDGKIVAMGVGIEIPDDATIVDTKGKVLTPGFIDAYTRLGLVEVGGVAHSNDTDSGFHSPIRAAQRTTDSLNLYSTLIPIQRAHGITTVCSVPRGGLISGQAAVFNLRPGGLLEAKSAMAVTLGGQNEGSRGARFLKLRETLSDARLYGQNKSAFQANRLRSFRTGPLDLEALGPVLSGAMPLLVKVHRRSDIESVVRLASEENIRIILVGAQEAWQVAPLLSKHQIPVILDPTAVLPGSFDGIHVRPDAPRVLAEAGVQIAISTMSSHNVRKLRQWAGNAVRESLSRADALKAVTSQPAQILGIKNRGHLAPGMVADVVVWSGDPFELSTKVNGVYISGEPQKMNNRQLQLFERYRHLDQ